MVLWPTGNPIVVFIGFGKPKPRYNTKTLVTLALSRFCRNALNFLYLLPIFPHDRALYEWMFKKKNQSDHDNQSEDKKISQLTKKKANLLVFFKANLLKRGKTRVSRTRLHLVLNLIGWEDYPSFRHHSQSKVKQMHSDPRLVSKLDCTFLYPSKINKLYLFII